MRDELQQRYDWFAVRERLPAERGALFLGYVPAEEEQAGWRRAAYELLPEAPGRTLRRTTWESADTRDARVMADVIECVSADAALDALGDRLEYNQMARLDDGPADLGHVSYVHPPPAPPAVFFVRGNLCMMVASIGRRPADVLSWARRIDGQLTDRPVASRQAIEVRTDDDVARTGTPMRVHFQIIEAYTPDVIRIFAEGARLAYPAPAEQPRTILLTPSRPGEVRVELFVSAAGREPLNGTLLLTAQ